MPHSSTNPSRVGIVGRLVGSNDSWSGIPEGLAGGLRRLGFDPFFLSAEPAPRTEEAARKWLNLTGRLDSSSAQTPEMMLLRSSIARMRRSRQPATNHWVQMGSEFGHPVDNFVTFEDMTVAQASEMPDYPALRDLVRRSWIRRQKEIYRRARACLVASGWAAEGLAHYGVKADKVHVVGFGCNVQVDVEQRDWRTPRFVFIGLGWKRKNGDAVVEAFADLLKDRPDARLDLVGDHPRIDQPGVVCHGELRRQVAAERSELEALLRESTCLVVPSTYEPFGIVYAEAGWAGMPSIGTTIGGAADAIGSGGIVVDPHKPEQLVRSMRAMSEPDRAYVLGLEAREHARLLTWDLVSRRVAGALGLLDGETEPDLPLSQPMVASRL
jgi:Glycosyl transferases group 1